MWTMLSSVSWFKEKFSGLEVVHVKIVINCLLLKFIELLNDSVESDFLISCSR